MKKKDKKWDIITAIVLIAVAGLLLFGISTCVRSCNEPDPFENDEYYNQSIGRQLMMEQSGMYREAEREKELRRAYMNRRTKEIEQEKQQAKKAKREARKKSKE